MAKLAGQQRDNFFAIGFRMANPFPVRGDESCEILAPFALQCFGGFDRNRQRVIDDFGPRRHAVKALLLGDETVGPRHQCRLDFFIEQHLKGILIGAEKLQLDISVNRETGRLLEMFRRTARRAPALRDTRWCVL